MMLYQNNLFQMFHFGLMLSGGLDSSIITAYASNFCKNNDLPRLKTFSVDYLDNDKNFVKSDFQPNADDYFISVMKDTFDTDHKKIVLDTPELASSLYDAMISRDCPRNGRCRFIYAFILQRNKKRYYSCAFWGMF